MVLQKDRDCLSVDERPSAGCERAEIGVCGEVDGDMTVGRLDIKSEYFRRKNIMIRVLFVCHGSILKSSGKACKIDGFTARYGTYYTTTTPFLKEP